MTTDEILAALRREGVEVELAGNGLKVRATKARLTEEQRKLLTENKAALLARLSAQVAPSVPEPKKVSDDGTIYKEFVYPNGKVLRLTKAEFDRVVDVFKMLIDQQTKLILQGVSFRKGPKEKGISEPDRTPPHRADLVE
jgi:hypothetical protein